MEDQMTDFDLEVANNSIAKVEQGEEFFYISKASTDNGQYTIGSTTKEFFEKFNKEWWLFGKGNKFKMTQATVGKVKALIAHNQFLQDKDRELMIMSRAKLYLDTLIKQQK